jgi:hypothetical protein
MKSRDGKSQKGEEKKKDDQKEKVAEERGSRRAKRQESREPLCFFNDLAPEGRKEGSLKRRLRSQRAR